MFLILMPLTALAQDITIEHFCEAQVEHVPDAGVNYDPDADFKDKKVAPADLNRVLNSLVDPIEIPINIDVIEWLGQPQQPGVEIEPEVAHIDLYKDGRIEYNGQDITGRVSYICNDGQPPEPVEIEGSVAQSGGQNAADVIPSSGAEAQTPPTDLQAQSAPAPEEQILEGQAN